MKSNRKNCLILGTSIQSLVNFRGDIAKSLSQRGLKVFLSSSDCDLDNLNFFSYFKNIKYRAIHLNRNGLSFYDDIKTFFDILILTKEVKPRFILAYGIKPVIWGGISSRVLHVPFFALITGLGFAFQGGTLQRRFLKKLVVFLYSIALKKSKAVIFQNKDNHDLFVKEGIVSRCKTHIVNGSGVDIKKYNVARFSKSSFSFLCISRLLGEKGLREYAAAAKIVKGRYPDVEFNLLGPEDPSPDAISLEEVGKWSKYINYNSSVDDVRPHIKACHVYVLPSYHEGLPRSTLEAMSMGRPILTTNAVGCRETVEDGVNGFMVAIGSAPELAEKMIWYIENKDRINNMGLESRRIVENRFDIRKVNKEMLRILEVE